MTGKEIAQMLAWVALWAAIIIVVISMLGCLTISQDTDRRLGGFVVNADCDEDTVHVELQIEDQRKKQDAGIER